MWNLRRCSQWIMAGLVLALTGTAGAQNLSVGPVMETAYNIDSSGTVHRDSTMRFFLWHVPSDTNRQRTKVEFAWEYRKTAAAGGDTLILADSLGNPLFTWSTAGVFTSTGGSDSLKLGAWTLKNKSAGTIDTLLVIDSTRVVYKLVGTNIGGSPTTATKLEISATAGTTGSHPDGSAYLRMKAAANRYQVIEFFELDTEKWRIFNDPTNDTLVFQGVNSGTPWANPVKFTQDGRIIADTLITHHIGGGSPILFLKTITDTLIFAQHRVSATQGWNRGGFTIGPVTMHYLGTQVGFTDSSLILASSVDDSAGAQFAFTDDGELWILGRGRDGGTTVSDGVRRSAELVLMTPRRNTSKPNGTEASRIRFHHYDLETGSVTGIATGSTEDWAISSTAAGNQDTSLDITVRGGYNGFVVLPQLQILSAAEGDTARLILSADQGDDKQDSSRIAMVNNGKMLLQTKGTGGFVTRIAIGDTGGVTVDSLSWTTPDSGQITPVDFSTWTADPDFWSSTDDTLEVSVAWDTVGNAAGQYIQYMIAQPPDTMARLQRIDVWSPIMTVPPGFVGVDTVYCWTTDNIAIQGSNSDTVTQSLFLYRVRQANSFTGSNSIPNRAQLQSVALDQASWASTDRGTVAFNLSDCAGLTRYSRFQFRWQASAWYRGHSPAIGGMVIKWKRQ